MLVLEHMDKKFFIIIGRSGSGKGTQSELLKRALLEKGVSNVINVTTGATFRQLIQGDSYTAKKSHEVNETGGLQPDFLAVWSWSNIFVNSLGEGDTVILDGAPRKLFEADVLHSAVTFFGYTKPTVIYIDTSESVSLAQSQGRGREDDKSKDGLANRFSWFETEVLPTIDFYIHDPRYSFLHINGNQTIAEVHQEIMNKIEALN